MKEKGAAAKIINKEWATPLRLMYRNRIKAQSMENGTRVANSFRAAVPSIFTKEVLA